MRSRPRPAHLGLGIVLVLLSILHLAVARALVQDGMRSLAIYSPEATQDTTHVSERNSKAQPVYRRATDVTEVAGQTANVEARPDGTIFTHNTAQKADGYVRAMPRHNAAIYKRGTAEDGKTKEQKRLEAYETKRKNLADKHATAFRELKVAQRKEKTDLRQKQAEESKIRKAERERKTEKLRSQSKDSLSQLKDTHKQKAAKTTVKHQKQLDNIKDALSSAWRRLTDKHDRKTRILSGQHRRKEHRTEDKHQEQADKLELANFVDEEKFEQRNVLQRERLRNKHSAARRKLRHKHETKTSKLKAKYGMLKTVQEGKRIVASARETKDTEIKRRPLVQSSAKLVDQQRARAAIKREKEEQLPQSQQAELVALRQKHDQELKDFRQTHTVAQIAQKLDYEKQLLELHDPHPMQLMKLMELRRGSQRHQARQQQKAQRALGKKQAEEYLALKDQHHSTLQQQRGFRENADASVTKAEARHHRTVNGHNDPDIVSGRTAGMSARPAAAGASRPPGKIVRRASEEDESAEALSVQVEDERSREDRLRRLQQQVQNAVAAQHEGEMKALLQSQRQKEAALLEEHTVKEGETEARFQHERFTEYHEYGDPLSRYLHYAQRLNEFKGTHIAMRDALAKKHRKEARVLQEDHNMVEDALESKHRRELYEQEEARKQAKANAAKASAGMTKGTTKLRGTNDPFEIGDSGQKQGTTVDTARWPLSEQEEIRYQEELRTRLLAQRSQLLYKHESGLAGLVSAHDSEQGARRQEWNADKQAGKHNPEWYDTQWTDLLEKHAKQLKAMKKNHRAQQKKLRAEHNRLVIGQAENRAAAREADDVKRKLSQLNASKVNQSPKDSNSLWTKISGLRFPALRSDKQKATNAKKESMKQRQLVGAHRAAAESLYDKHQDEMHDLQLDHAEEQHDKEDKWQDKESAVKDHDEKGLLKLRLKHDAKLEKLRAKHGSKQEAMRQKHMAKESALAAEHDQEKTRQADRVKEALAYEARLREDVHAGEVAQNVKTGRKPLKSFRMRLSRLRSKGQTNIDATKATVGPKYGKPGPPGPAAVAAK